MRSLVYYSEPHFTANRRKIEQALRSGRRAWVCYNAPNRVRRMRTFIIGLLAALCMPARASGQTSWAELQVPTAAFGVLHVDVGSGASLAMNRLVRVLHSHPREGDAAPAVQELEKLLASLDAFEQEARRLGSRGLSLEMSRNSGERDVLQDVLKELGFRLRERRGEYQVEPAGGDSAAALRAQLATAGIDTTTLEAKLNRGEALMPAPSVTAVPNPLSLETWMRVIFERDLPPRSVFSAIVHDRQASLLFVGLAAMTPRTRAYLSSQPDLLRRLYRDCAGSVAGFGDALELDEANRPMLPGGSETNALWEELVDEKIDHPDRFARALFDRDNGRLAYFVHTLAHLDPGHQKFALGLQISDGSRRLERFRALYKTFVNVDPNWSVANVPFVRPAYDPATLLIAVQVTASGTPLAPAQRRLWEKAIDGEDLPPPSARELGDVAREGGVDAAWLAEHLPTARPTDARAMIGRLAFAQRTFAAASAAELEDVLTALRGFSRFPALMLAVETIGIHTPSTFAMLARRAHELDGLNDPVLAVPAVGQFQSGIALLSRLARTGAIDARRGDSLLRSLAAVNPIDGRYDGGIATWLSGQLLPAVSSASGTAHSLESTLLEGLADRGELQQFGWAGESYAVDLRAASLNELVAIRKKQGSNSLDDVLRFAAAVRALEEPKLTIEAIRQGSATLSAAAARLMPLRSWPDIQEPPQDLRKAVERVTKELDRLKKPNDANKAARIVHPLLPIVDAAVTDTLMALAYAPSVDSATDLPGTQTDVSHRHRFGFDVKSGSSTERIVWRRTRRDFSSASGRGLAGSVMTLDLANGPKRLRRLAADAVPKAPRLNGNDVDSVTEALGLLNPRQLTSSDLLAIGDAITRGRRKARSAADAEMLDGLAVKVGMPGDRRQALSWALHIGTEPVDTLFSMAELLRLGLGDVSVAMLDSWGTTAEPVSGCLCLQFPADQSWALLAGRPSTGVLAAAMPDTLLRAVEHMAVVHAPAALVPGVMALATQHFIDTAVPLYADDWFEIVGRSNTLTQGMVEDYVGSLVANGPVQRATSGEHAP